MAVTTYFKPIVGSTSVKEQIATDVILNDSGVTYTLCDRTDLTSVEANYFVSFNLPYVSTAFPLTNTLSTIQPELQQLNVDEIVIIPIPKESYNEIIDGRSITLKCPQISGTGYSAKTIVSSTYSTLRKGQNSGLLGTNIAYLFCDEINIPYTGNTGGSLNISHATNTSWNPGPSFVNRPAAVSFEDLIDTPGPNIKTDDRVGNYAVSVPVYYPLTSNFVNIGYNYDVPIGFVCLDKGYIVLTHPTIVSNMPFDKGLKPGGAPNTGPTLTKDIYFSDITKSSVTFRDLDTRFKTSYIALIQNAEFYISTNPTWDFAFNYAEDDPNTGGKAYSPIYISEVGLFNDKQELIAIAKLDRPVKKEYGDFIAFTLDINI